MTAHLEAVVVPSLPEECAWQISVIELYRLQGVILVTEYSIVHNGLLQCSGRDCFVAGCLVDTVS